MICKDLDSSGGTEKVVAPGIEGSHDRKQLSVVDIVVAFSRAERLRQVGTRAPFVIDVLLQENSSRGVFGGIRGDSKRGREIWEVEDWLGGECRFEGNKGIVT